MAEFQRAARLHTHRRALHQLDRFAENGQVRNCRLLRVSLCLFLFFKGVYTFAREVTMFQLERMFGSSPDSLKFIEEITAGAFERKGRN